VGNLLEPGKGSTPAPLLASVRIHAATHQNVRPAHSPAAVWAPPGREGWKWLDAEMGTADWWARGIAAAGLVVSVVALALEFVRYRQSRPHVELRVKVKPGDEAHQLIIKLLNRGGSPVGISRYILTSEDVNEEHDIRLSHRLIGREIPARGVLRVTAHVEVRHDGEERVPYRFVVGLATGQSVSSKSFVLAPRGPLE
jgi:hypothetical protein